MGICYAAVCHERREYIDAGDGNDKLSGLPYWSNALAHMMALDWCGRDVRMLIDAEDEYQSALQGDPETWGHQPACPMAARWVDATRRAWQTAGDCDCRPYTCRNERAAELVVP